MVVNNNEDKECSVYKENGGKLTRGLIYAGSWKNRSRWKSKEEDEFWIDSGEKEKEDKVCLNEKKIQVGGINEESIEVGRWKRRTLENRTKRKKLRGRISFEISWSTSWKDSGSGYLWNGDSTLSPDKRFTGRIVNYARRLAEMQTQTQLPFRVPCSGTVS